MILLSKSIVVACKFDNAILNVVLFTKHCFINVYYYHILNQKVFFENYWL